MLTVYDGTGTIEVRQFADPENDDLQVCDGACTALSSCAVVTGTGFQVSTAAT